MKNLTSIIAGLTLLVILSCTPNNTRPKPTPTPPTKTTTQKSPEKILHYRINLLAKDLANSIERYFPQGRVINLGRKEKGAENRYLVSRVLNEHTGKSFEISLYMGSNKQTETIIRKHLLNKRYGPAINELNKSNFTITSIRDPEIYSPIQKADYLLNIRNKKKKITSIEATNPYLSKEIIYTYTTLLEKLKSL